MFHRAVSEAEVPTGDEYEVGQIVGGSGLLTEGELECHLGGITVVHTASLGLKCRTRGVRIYGLQLWLWMQLGRGTSRVIRCLSFHLGLQLGIQLFRLRVRV